MPTSIRGSCNKVSRILSDGVRSSSATLRPVIFESTLDTLQLLTLLVPCLEGDEVFRTCSLFNGNGSQLAPFINNVGVHPYPIYEWNNGARPSRQYLLSGTAQLLQQGSIQSRVYVCKYLSRHFHVRTNRTDQQGRQLSFSRNRKQHLRRKPVSPATRYIPLAKGYSK